MGIGNGVISFTNCKQASKEISVSKSLGLLLTTWDGDKHHFSRVLAEYTRLGYPFAVNFDHCCKETKRLFKTHPNFVGCYENDDPKHVFDETHKQHALDVLVKLGFDWGGYFDTDDILDRRAPQLIPEMLEWDCDLIWCPAIDLWGDAHHYRVDGPLGPSHEPDQTEHFGKQRRDCFWNLKTGNWKYKHADVHAPYFEAKDGSGRAARRRRSKLHIIHHGRMDPKDAMRHEKMWDKIYTRALGRNPYRGGFYTYMAETEPVLEYFDYDTFDGD